MQLSAILALLSTAVALAAPAAPEVLVAPEARAHTYVQLCSDAHLSGKCDLSVSLPGACNPIFYTPMQSLRPLESFCYFYTVPDCGHSGDYGDFFHVLYPGVEDLVWTPVNGLTENATRNFADKIKSYICQEAIHST